MLAPPRKRELDRVEREMNGRLGVSMDILKRRTWFCKVLVIFIDMFSLFMAHIDVCSFFPKIF